MKSKILLIIVMLLVICSCSNNRYHVRYEKEGNIYDVEFNYNSYRCPIRAVKYDNTSKNNQYVLLKIKLLGGTKRIDSSPEPITLLGIWECDRYGEIPVEKYFDRFYINYQPENKDKLIHKIWESER